MSEKVTYVRQFHRNNPALAPLGDTYIMVLTQGLNHVAWIPKESPYIPCEASDTDDQVAEKVFAFVNGPASAEAVIA